MQPTQTHLRPVSANADLRHEPVGESEKADIRGPRNRFPVAPVLTPLQCVGGFLVFVVWLVLFGAGIMVDTAPYRASISAEGARQLQIEGQPASERSTAGSTQALSLSSPSTEATTEQRAEPSTHSGSAQASAAPAIAQTESSTVSSMTRAWLVVLFCFLPLNLAWLCVSASTLGAVGNMANLSDDRDTKSSPDMSNPVTSAILRGFFVYLFLMSGLLLLDHTPFSNAGPSQYIRLAGFLSLFSFVVSYHPHLFGALIVSAFERIQVRAGDNNGGSTTVQHTSVRSVEIESTSAASGPAEGPSVAQRPSGS